MNVAHSKEVIAAGRHMAALPCKMSCCCHHGKTVSCWGRQNYLVDPHKHKFFCGISGSTPQFFIVASQRCRQSILSYLS